MDINDYLNAALKAQSEAIPLLIDAIAAASEAGDAGGRGLLERILADTEDHVDGLETRLYTIREIGIKAYLALP
jgi:bacterioferritin (cytochrome b1)